MPPLPLVELELATVELVAPPPEAALVDELADEVVAAVSAPVVSARVQREGGSTGGEHCDCNVPTHAAALSFVVTNRGR